MKIGKNVILPSLSGFQYGYNTSVIAGAIYFITHQFSLSKIEEGWVVSIAFLGTCLACFSGVLANKIGKKLSLILGALFFLAGAVLTSATEEYSLLLLGRLLIGFGAGIAITVSPLYLIEISPPDIRGKILNMNQIGIGLGTVAAFSVAYLFAASGNWRAMFAMGIVPAVVQVFGLFFIEEKTNREQRKKTYEAVRWKTLLESVYRLRLKVVFLLALFQALSGTAAISYYTPIIFKNAGFDTIQTSLLATLFFGIVYLIALLLSFAFVDRFGRRPLLFASFVGMALSQLAVAFFSLIHFPYMDVVSMASVLLFSLSFALGVGPVPPLITNEISPGLVRGHLMTLMGLIGWLVNYLVTLTFPILLAGVSISGVFALYAFFNLLGLWVLSKRIPETKQKSLEEIDRIFEEQGKK